MFFKQCNVLLVFWCLNVSLAQATPIIGVHTGIDGATGARPIRRNILDFQNDVPSWSLYIQALTAMQAVDQNDIASWYQIMGIHGRPYTAWDNVGANPFAGSPSWPAYCEHNSILFPIWHRPYLAMYEQTLASHVQTVASQYSNNSSKSIYQGAADNFRIPYWDWATTPSMPAIVNVKNVTITTPSGVETVVNPLYAYAIPNLQTDLFPVNAGDGYLALDPTSLRSPDSNNVSQPDVVNAAMEAGNYRDLIYNLFTRVSDYSTFATDINPGTSIEIIHGNVHNAIGGAKGHMTLLSYSAFDPIFFLHHAQVDRLFAMWQAIHPDAWLPVAGQANQAGTFTIPYGQVETSDTPLTPFYRSSNNTFWTAESARSLPQWGYSYPEISDWNQSPSQLADNVTAQINGLYGSTSSTASKSTTSRRKADERHNQRDTTWNETSTTEWFLRVSVDKMAVGGSSFNVRFFLEAPPENTETWCHATNLIATLTSLVPMTMKVSAGKKHAEFPITKVLEDNGFVMDDVGAVIDALGARLEWRIQKIDGSEVDVESIESLDVEIVSEEVTIGSGFPSYGASTSHGPMVNGGKLKLTE